MKKLSKSLHEEQKNIISNCLEVIQPILIKSFFYNCNWFFKQYHERNKAKLNDDIYVTAILRYYID